MNLTRIALRNAQFVVILLLIAITLGVRSFINMPRSEDPQISFPIYVITVVFPGTGPEDMERLVVDPLEEVIDRVDDLRDIASSISDGLAVITIEASYEVDRDDKYNEILREVNSIRTDLPSGIAFFDVVQISPDDRVSFFALAVSSDQLPYKALHDVAENIETEFERIEGINEVTIEAYPDRQVVVSLDYQRMSAQNINLGQVITTLRTNNVVVPGGSVRAGPRVFSIQSTGGFDNIEEIQKTIITSANNNIVYLKDIADVSIKHEDQLWTAQYNGKKSIFVNLKLKRGFNILEVDKNVRRVLEEFKTTAPKNVALNVAFEQASAVDGRINDFFTNLLQGIFLVGLIILLVLGWRSALIIVVLIPLCIILALAILSGAGYGLQQISIAALVIALGLLVDNGIVVIENITRFIKEGYNRKDASREGTMEVGAAITSSTITTLLSFFPLTQLGEGPGEYLKSLPLTVILTLIISLILALAFSPILSNWIMPKKLSKELSLADRSFNWLSDQVYLPVLKFAMKFRWAVVITAILITAFSISLFSKIGISFFPTADKPLLLIEVNTPTGSSLEETEKAVNFAEEVLSTKEYVKDYTSNVGHGNLQVYYNRIPQSYVKSHGQLLANLDGWDSRRFYELINDLRKEFNRYTGAKITLSELKNGAPVEAPIVIRVFGKDLEILKDLSLQVEDIFKNTPDVINITNDLRRPQTQLELRLDKEKAGLLNIAELDFDQTVRASINGMTIDNVSLDDDEDYDLVIRMPFDISPSIQDLDKIYITSRTGGQVPLNHIAKTELVSSVSNISHYNLDRHTNVMADVVDLDNTIGTTIAMFDRLDAIDWPSGYYYQVSGEYEEQQKTFGNLGVILGMAGLAIFAVLVLQFRSMLQPLIVFASIPLAVSGSFIMLYLTGWRFSFFAFVGFISLTGIVVNNSIILVDYINQLRREGIELVESIIRGSIRRFKPIILTTMTTILGLLPITLQGSNLWSPLCLTIIGGMISSTALTLLVVPILYKWFTTKSPTDKKQVVVAKDSFDGGTPKASEV